ncbi:MAG: hypothetical protein ACE5IY_23625 [bacterium]
MTTEYERGGVTITKGDSLNLYQKWEGPTAIISDGPYGLGSFQGDPPTPFELDSLYEQHIIQWSRFSTPLTTLWFWNSEIGWATVHPVLQKHGWEIGCMDHYIKNAKQETLCGVPAEYWPHFFKIFVEQRDEATIKEQIDRLRKKADEITTNKDDTQHGLIMNILNHIDALLNESD